MGSGQKQPCSASLHRPLLPHTFLVRLLFCTTSSTACYGLSKALVPVFKDDFDITVFDLDQFIFKHQSQSVQKLAEKEINRICSELRNFDCVNIQLEHGTFGNDSKIIFRRIKKIIQNSHTICITFHTIMPSDGLDIFDILKKCAAQGLREAINAYKSHKRATILGDGIYNLLKNEQRKRDLSVIVHTRRDRRMLQIVHGIKYVYDHPLAYFTPNKVTEIYKTSDRSKFTQLKGLPDDAILLGCFGFISSYKGIDTAIKALSLLPKNYHLAIFGGVHPAAIKKNQLIDPFIASLLGEIAPGKTWLDFTSVGAERMNINVSGADLISFSDKKNPRDMSSRVHFMGALSDDDFPVAMAICDTVLLPYVEVGQSSSGPMSTAVDLRKHVIAARTKAFMQYARYHKDRFNMFDIGNYLQLMQLILADSRKTPAPYPPPEINALTNMQTYLKALFQKIKDES